MSACEKCWRTAQAMNMPYDLLVQRLNEAGRICTPEEQAGPNADQCPTCERWTLHQHTGQPMCGCPDTSRTAVQAHP